MPEAELTAHELHILSLVKRGGTVTPTVRIALNGFTAIDVDATLIDKLYKLGLIRPDDNCGDLEGVPAADGVMVKVCEHGGVHVLMIDSARKPIATAFFTLNGWADISDDVIEQAEAVVPGLAVAAATRGESRH